MNQETTQAYSLENLNDIIVPDGLGIFPLAPGMTLLICFVIGLLFYWSYHQWVTYKSDAYRRQALHEIALIQQQQSPLSLLALPALMKRVALTRYSDEQVASLSGLSWLQFLEKSSGISEFNQWPGNSLATLPYDKSVVARLTPQEQQVLFQLCRRWIKQHRII